MASSSTNVRRILQLKFTLPAGTPAQLLSMVKGFAPFYEMFGGVEIRLLQNVDDPTRLVQIIEYETPEAMEGNRQQIASDPRIQAYLQGWRTLAPGGVEVEVYREVDTP
ncbi:MAG TPA: hypothetical protein VHN11_09730 [Xanthobacteraceae bacterium]|jgi:hypothetical protein|nr:hypothetical protein [Xanthobacteraceae bacterium]